MEDNQTALKSFQVKTIEISPGFAAVPPELSPFVAAPVLVAAEPAPVV